MKLSLWALSNAPGTLGSWGDPHYIFFIPHSDGTTIISVSYDLSYECDETLSRIICMYEETDGRRKKQTDEKIEIVI